MPKRVPKSSSASLDPSFQTTLEQGGKQHTQAAEAMRVQKEILARVRTAHQHARDAWLQLRDLKLERTQERKVSNAHCHDLAKLIVTLGGVLKQEGFESNLSMVRVEPDDKDKTCALAILKKGVANDRNGVLAMVKAIYQSAENLPTFVFSVDSWLREGLMDEVLGISKPPEPPAGFEGDYLEAVETKEDFLRWLDLEIWTRENFDTRPRTLPSDGRSLRNAYLLIDMLGITDVPEQPTGTMTIADELTQLRNLRRQCCRRSKADRDSHAESPNDETVPSRPKLTPTERKVLVIIKSQRKGKGMPCKKIVTKLKTKGITIKETTVRRHILPKLAEHYGVVNIRGAGGYLIPPHGAGT